jgi:hypothetical protein
VAALSWKVLTAGLAGREVNASTLGYNEFTFLRKFKTQTL